MSVCSTLPGQRVAVLRSSFVDVVHEYFASAVGRVAMLDSDAAGERGSEILTLLVSRSDCGTKPCDAGEGTPPE